MFFLQNYILSIAILVTLTCDKDTHSGYKTVDIFLLIAVRTEIVLRQEHRSLRKLYKVASEKGKQPPELRNILRKKLITLHRAEWHQRRGKDRERKRTAFISNSFVFTKKLLGDKRTGKLMCSTAEANTFLHDTLSDLERDQELGSQRALISP